MDHKIDYTKYTIEALQDELKNIDKSDNLELYNELYELISKRVEIQNKLNTNNKREPAGCLGYVIGGMSFIPLLGVIFGIVAIVWGFKSRNSKLKYIGSAGILFTVIIYSSLGYFSFVQEGGIYDDLRSTMAKTQLTGAVQAIEFYKVQNGQYPTDLKTLQSSLPENSMVFLHDAAQVNISESKFYYYKLINENTYHIRSFGRDGIINTTDDIFPSAIENIGLVVNYQVSNE